MTDIEKQLWVAIYSAEYTACREQQCRHEGLRVYAPSAADIAAAAYLAGATAAQSANTALSNLRKQFPHIKDAGQQQLPPGWSRCTSGTGADAYKHTSGSSVCRRDAPNDMRWNWYRVQDFSCTEPTDTLEEAFEIASKA